MSILDIKTDLSQAFAKTKRSRSNPFESVNPPKQGEYPQLLPDEVAKTFTIGNPTSSPEVSIGKARGSLKISDFSQGDIFHTQPYIDTPIRAEVQFPLTQIKNHRIRIGSFLDSNEGQLFIANQSTLQQYNAMPESFDGSSARDGVYKVYKSDNRVFSPLGIRGSLQPGFSKERHKINRSTTTQAFGRFAIDKEGERSTYITSNFPGLLPNAKRQKPEAVERQGGLILPSVIEGFGRRFEASFQNQMASVVEQAFLDPKKLKIQKIGPTFKSIAANALGGSLGDLIGAGSRQIMDRGTDVIAGFFGGLTSNISFGDGPIAKTASRFVNAGVNIAIDVASTFVQQSFQEAVVQQTNKLGVYVGKRLGVDPKFVTGPIQAAFARSGTVTLSQVSPTNNLNKYNILAPYSYASRHEQNINADNIWVKRDVDGNLQAGYGKNMAVSVHDVLPFIHVARLDLLQTDNHNFISVNPDKLYPAENIIGDGYKQITYKVLNYSALQSDDVGVGNWHPAKLADQDVVTYLQSGKGADTLGNYGIKPTDGVAKDETFGRYKSSQKSDKVTLHRPHHDNNEFRDDFVTFAFHDVTNKKHIQFRAILGAITDTVRPEYDPIRYLGRADQVYIYKGAVRNINFTFKFAAQTKQELLVGWEKLNYLVGLAYPAGYDNGRMIAPLVNLTLGGMFDKAPGLINNISLTVTDQSPWEIDKNIELPKYVEASVDFQYIGKYPIKGRGKHYGLTYVAGDGDKLVPEIDPMMTDVAKTSRDNPEEFDFRVDNRDIIRANSREASNYII